ncbi:MAG: ribonuclease M5 [Clostridiales bacterium]|nr:ribonuclease M5 [Clostridiales bacterium]
MIKEVIVVEGKDDVSAVKRAVKAEIIITGGFALRPETINRIKTAMLRQGVIIFTDPDFAGEKIRKIIASKVQGCKHAFLPKNEATFNGNIGIENASVESILLALNKARSQTTAPRCEFSQKDMTANGLVGAKEASMRRVRIGEALGVGYGNAKQFLSRLNNYGITREEFENTVSDLKAGK